MNGPVPAEKFIQKLRDLLKELVLLKSKAHSVGNLPKVVKKYNFYKHFSTKTLEWKHQDRLQETFLDGTRNFLLIKQNPKRHLQNHICKFSPKKITLFLLFLLYTIFSTNFHLTIFVLIFFLWSDWRTYTERDTQTYHSTKLQKKFEHHQEIRRN